MWYTSFALPVLPTSSPLCKTLTASPDAPSAPGHRAPTSSYGADRRISDDAHSFLLAFRSKFYKKTYENNPSNENKKGSENKFNASPGLPAKKPTVRADGPTKAGVKRGPSDQLEELATKKKAMLNKTKMATTDKKVSGLEQREAAAAMALMASGTLAARQPRASMEKKTNAIIAKKKEPAAAAVAVPAIKRPIKTPLPMALMMTFPPNTTLPSVAALKGGGGGRVGAGCEGFAERRRKEGQNCPTMPVLCVQKSRVRWGAHTVSP
ncbi:hypothetical protein GUJ93_ZPchr0008g11685 [Zizania palustris]|uniref:Uncharacterized protein n=1 Tax=Zizania palustris TaxID=103762 RepID=A0A8J5RV06_ZIZPA|nr:hypothetical protein GUJ93_ZPchr0008g11685 [Zizania palustris]